jgi:DNA polymerase III subunit epsilon
MRALGGRRPAAPHPRRGLPWSTTSMVALDFETTGLDADEDHVIAYGAVPIERGRVLVGSARSQLIRPPTPPSPTSQTIHLLRTVDLADAPETRVAAAGLRDALAGRFLVTWFADVEIAFLRRLFGGSVASWRRRVIDVRDMTIVVDGSAAGVRRARGYALTQTADRFGVPVSDPHDALDDALVTAQLFLVLAGRLPGRPTPTARELTALYATLT